MLSFTLDTNCIIDVDDARPEASAIRALADAHAAGAAQVGLVAMSASECQLDGGQLENFALFRDRIASLSLAHLDLLQPMFYWDVTFWDASLWVEPSMLEREAAIQEILFPNIPVSWQEYCRDLGLDAEANTIDRKWRNAKCDVQAFWSHSFHQRDIFVTTDRNFHTVSRKARLIALAGGRIERPDAAAELLRFEAAAT